MPKFEFSIAMDIRAYGSVTIESETPEQALEKLDAAYVASEFSPDGNADALDWQHPRDIYVFPSNHILDDGDEIETLDRDIPEGPWASKEPTGSWLVTYDPDSDQILVKLFSSEELANEFAWTIALNISDGEYSDVEQLKEKFDNAVADAVGELSGWRQSIAIDYHDVHEIAGVYDGKH